MWRELHTEDRGDGALIVVPPDTPASAVAARALGTLHAGPVIRDAQGVTGHAINETAHLVQARILRKLLTETRADLGVIVSAYIYDYVIWQHEGQPVDATPYQKIRFRVKESALTAWLHLTGVASE